MGHSDSSVRRTVVAVEPVEADIRAAVRRALDGVEWKRVIPRGAALSLKVNLGWDLFIPGSITSPAVVEALILEMREHVGPIHVVEAEQVLEDVEKAFHRSGMDAVCRRTGATWVNMSHAPVVVVDAPDNVILRRVELPRILQETLVVTVPVMKTHAKTVLSGAIKNQWGCLDKMRHEYHLVLEDALADLNSLVRPVLSLMDATVGLEGNGPKSGQPRFVDRILCSTDPVALDVIQASLMGIDPASVRHLTRCAERGIGIADPARIDLRGPAAARQATAFLPANHNAVSRVEDLLRRSVVKRLFFNTPIFRSCLIGAKLYYRLWTMTRAGVHWKKVRNHPVYGPQWEAGWPGLGSGAKTPGRAS